MHALDIAGAGFSLLSTLCFVLAVEMAWPLGVVATLLNASLYGLLNIYGNLSLEIIYFVMMWYGWYQWHASSKHHQGFVVRRLTPRTGVILVGVLVVGIFSIYSLLRMVLHSPVVLLDMFTTLLSLLAQWMTCQKIIESWWVWFVVNVMYVSLYFDRHLPFHSGLLIIYLGMAVWGYYRWRQLMRREHGQSHYRGRYSSVNS